LIEYLVVSWLLFPLITSLGRLLDEPADFKFPHREIESKGLGRVVWQHPLSR